MQILSPEALSLTPVPSAADDAPPQSHIVRNGQPTGRQVLGAVLELAAQWQSFYLLLTTDDTPFEELLHIHLLGADLRLLDSATLGGIYATGSFSPLDSTAPDTLRFRFIGGTDWSVQVLPEAGFRMPLLSEPPGVSRPLGFTRHFIVRGQPQPERG
ncbi:hypothetical protein [Paracidovorax sp. MALMAid1276]|uniref:hypothetical protein n=1 Tax=Paracidovorax sp. MALMAid1276 TaxID=3411631 RepID=UPI003B9BA8BD